MYFGTCVAKVIILRKHLVIIMKHKICLVRTESKINTIKRIKFQDYSEIVSSQDRRQIIDK